MLMKLFKLILSGIDMKSPDELKKIDRKVEAKVKGNLAVTIYAIINLVSLYSTFINVFVNRNYRQVKG